MKSSLSQSPEMKGPKNAPQTLLKGQRTPLQDELRELLFLSGLPVKGVAVEMGFGDRFTSKLYSGEKAIPKNRCTKLLLAIDQLEIDRHLTVRTKVSNCWKLVLSEIE